MNIFLIKLLHKTPPLKGQGMMRVWRGLFHGGVDSCATKAVADVSLALVTKWVKCFVLSSSMGPAVPWLSALYIDEMH